MIDKSTRQHYAIQGGGPNYLGKQKMVTAPKKWKSSPDHEPAELAYITKKEKDILLDLNLYGSLKNGKPNRGPSGIISLQGDMGSIGGGGGGGGGGGRDRWDWSPAPAPAPAPTQSPQASRAREEKAIADEARANIREQAMAKTMTPKAPKAAPTTTRDERIPDFVREIIAPTVTPKDERVPDFVKQIIAPTITPKDERVPDFVKEIIAPTITPKDERVPDFVKDIIEPKIDIGFQEELRKQKIARDLKIKQQDPRYGQFFRPTPVVEKPQGIMSSLLGKGKNIAGNMAKQFALSKLGLGFLNPFVGIASLFGFDPIGSLMANMANMSKGPGTKTTGQLDDIRGGGDGQVQAPANVIQASIQKFRPTDQQTSQMAEIQRKRDILQGYADKKGLNEQGMNTLAQMNQLISQYQADPRSIYG
jgi:hypothetical protein